MEALNRHLTGDVSSIVDEGEAAVYLGEEVYDDEKFYWKNITPQEVDRALRKGRSDAIGCDDLPLSLIVKALPSIMPILTHLFNYCLIYGVFPNIWKSAIICPIPKVKNPTELNDYRPISILCAVLKTLESIAANQITHFLEERDILDPFQSAYKRDFSTQTALIRVLDDVRYAADKRQLTIAVFFDFTKAFDFVCHRRLIDKLRELGFACSTLRWLCAYLTTRKQAVWDPLSGRMSSNRLVSRGVPQGSVLGPLLFSLYLKDFGTVPHHCKYNFYADDLLIYIHTEPRLLAEAIEKVNSDIDMTIQWATENKLTINPKKTKAMILGTRRYVSGLRRDVLLSIRVGGTVIPFVDEVVYLGVTINSALSWERQVSGTVSRVNRALYQLKLCGNFLPLNLRVRLVSSLIVPLFNYCCAVFTNVTEEQNLRLQRACNRCVRFIFRARWDEHITPYLARLG